MLYWYLLFFFVAFGAKLGLALVMIYLLLPADRRCSRCDEETLLMGGGTRMSRLRSWLLLGRVQWRWCPRCGWEGMARRGAGQPPAPGLPLGSRAPTRP